MSFCQWQGEDLILAVHVQPRASRDEWGEIFGERIKIRITAPPVEGAANQYLCKLLGKWFGVSQSQVELLSGAHGRDKRLRIKSPNKLPPIIPTP
jgi:uncharacterized protein